MRTATVGKVYLVGAGPGDAGLITVRGAELVDTGDAVVVDDLVNPVLLKNVRGKIFYVGKRGPGAPEGKSIKRAQPGINRLLVRLAQKGRRVVRLKGGDPIVFGRGGEEMEYLRRNGVRFEVVPGVTSPVGAAAYAGIPITDRRWASQITFLTGHESREAGRHGSRVSWSRLYPNQTLVILMGVTSWLKIRRELLSGGWEPSKPVAAIQAGTQKNQRILLSDLNNSARDFQKRKLRSPAVIIVGNVSNLSRSLEWVSKEKPLLGRRIVVTRAESQSHRIIRLLHDTGAEVLFCPTIEIVPLHGDPDVQEFFSRFNKGYDTFDWVVFLSANGVKTFADGLSGDRRLPPALRVCAVGPQTAQMVRSMGWRLHRIAKRFNAAGAVKALGSVRGKRILLPRVQGGPSEIVTVLRNKGASVRELAVYLNRPAPPPAPIIRKLLLSGVDAVTFTSASTARNFAVLFTPSERRLIFGRGIALSIGNQTTKALRSAGIRRVVQARRETVAHMVEELCRRLKRK